jgi:hypothetical protein
MNLADEAVARLNDLALLNDGNLVLLVRDLIGSAVASAPSCLAVIITVGKEEPLYAIDDRLREGAAIVRASLRAQITTSGSGTPGRQIVFLAERAREFADFTALDLPITATQGYVHHLVIDRDLDRAFGLTHGPPKENTAARVIDRAIGVLLDRGFPPDEALQELQTRASASGLTLSEQADLVLRSLR